MIRNANWELFTLLKSIKLTTNLSHTQFQVFKHFKAMYHIENKKQPSKRKSHEERDLEISRRKLFDAICS